MTESMSALTDVAHINWLGVAVGALAYYMLGALWFTPLFGKAWDRSIGHDRPKAERFGVAYYVVPLVSAVLVSVMLGIVLAASKPGGLADAMLIGLMVGVAAAAVSINNALTPHTPRPYLFGAVTGGYHLVGITVAAVLIEVISTQ